MLLECQEAHALWEKICSAYNIAFNHVWTYIVVGHVSELPTGFNFVFSLIAFTIYKKWIIDCSDNPTRSNLETYIHKELSFKYSVMEQGKYKYLARTLEKVIHKL